MDVLLCALQLCLPRLNYGSLVLIYTGLVFLLNWTLFLIVRRSCGNLLIDCNLGATIVDHSAVLISGSLMCLLMIENFAVVYSKHLRTIFFYLTKTAAILGLVKIFLIGVLNQCEDYTFRKIVLGLLFLLMWNVVELTLALILYLFSLYFETDDERVAFCDSYVIKV